MIETLVCLSNAMQMAEPCGNTKLNIIQAQRHTKSAYKNEMIPLNHSRDVLIALQLRKIMGRTDLPKAFPLSISTMNF